MTIRPTETQKPTGAPAWGRIGSSYTETTSLSRSWPQVWIWEHWGFGEFRLLIEYWPSRGTLMALPFLPETLRNAAS